MLVALTVVSLLMGAALTLTLSSRRTFASDSSRNALNQSLRGALDLVGNEIRRAGEWLPGDMPIVEIVDGGGDNPDELIVRRARSPLVLPLCEDLNAGSTIGEIRVGSASTVAPRGCFPVEDSNSDGYPDNIEAWRGVRTGLGGSVPVYLFNPTTLLGEWVDYNADGSTDAATYIGRDGSTPLQFAHGAGEQARLYLMEQRRYTLQNGILEFKLNEQNGATTRVVDRIRQIQARAILRDGTVLDSLDATTPTAQIEAIEITLKGEQELEETTLTRELTARFHPRSLVVQ